MTGPSMTSPSPRVVSNNAAYLRAPWDQGGQRLAAACPLHDANHFMIATRAPAGEYKPAQRHAA